MPGIPSGTLRQRVTLLKPQTLPDTFGQPLRVWHKVGTCWAELTGGGGGTTLTVNHMSITYTHTIRVRQCKALKDLSPLWRAEFNGNTMEISSVIDPSLDGAVWEIQCTEERPNTVGAGVVAP